MKSITAACLLLILITEGVAAHVPIANDDILTKPDIDVTSRTGSFKSNGLGSYFGTDTRGSPIFQGAGGLSGLLDSFPVAKGKGGLSGVLTGISFTRGQPRQPGLLTKSFPNLGSLGLPNLGNLGVSNILLADKRSLPECSQCVSSASCSTRKCWRFRCVFDTTSSRNKCFAASGALLPECSTCFFSSQCSTQKCWSGRCVFNNMASRNKCFSSSGGAASNGNRGFGNLNLPNLGNVLSPGRGSLPECSICFFSSQCSTRKCWAGRCVFDNAVSRNKCFNTSSGAGSGGNGRRGGRKRNTIGTNGSRSRGGNRGQSRRRGNGGGSARGNNGGGSPLKSECAACSASSECQSNKCWKRKCVDGSLVSIAKCFSNKLNILNFIRGGR